MSDRRERLAEYFNRRIEYQRWEIFKYAAITLCMLLPCVGRLFHYLSFSCLLTFMALYSLCFGLLMLFRTPRKWMIPFIVMGVGGLAYQLGLGKPLGYQTLTAMYETNCREILGFLSSPSSIFLVVGGVVALVILLWLIVGDRPLPFLHKHTFIRRKYLLPLLALSALLFGVTRWKIFETYPICLVYENFMYVDENMTIDDYTNTPYACPPEFRPSDDTEETYVLIIGEAARRLSLSAYGYERPTSPKLDALVRDHPANVVLYSDAISTAAFTKASVMCMYSPLTVPEELSAVHSRPGLSKIFRGSGMQTLYVTVRPKYKIPNMLSTFLDDAGKTRYLTTLTKRAYDDEAVPVIADFIGKNPGSKLVVWHLMGSHMEYAAEYPRSFRHFDSDRRMVDTYDDSIRYSDHVIHRAVNSLLGSRKPAAVLYVSDHGENLNDTGDGNFGHGTRALTPYELKVPFVFYFNDRFLERHPEVTRAIRERKDRPVSHDNVTHTFMGLAGIKDPFVYRSELDLGSSDFTPGTRWVTDENMRVFDYAAMDFSRTSKLRQIRQVLAEEYRSKFTW